MAQGETGCETGFDTGSGGAAGCGDGSELDSASATSGLDSGSGSPCACSAGSGGGGSLDTSVARRSMVGGARLGRSGSGSGPVSLGLSSTIAAVPLAVGRPNLAESAACLEHDPDKRAPVFRKACPGTMLKP
jgi:hypothetical protein